MEFVSYAEKDDEMVLALMWLVIHGDRHKALAWKSFDWDTLDWLTVARGRPHHSGKARRCLLCSVRSNFDAVGETCNATTFFLSAECLPLETDQLMPSVMSEGSQYVAFAIGKCHN